MANENVPCYIARLTKDTKAWPAGTAAAVVVDDGEHPEMVQASVVKWMREGCIIERTTVGWVRQHLFTQEPVTAGVADG